MIQSKMITRFVSARVRRASGSAQPARAITLRARRDPAVCCGVRRQSPAPRAPRLSACPRLPWRPKSRAFSRPRTSRAFARIARPSLRGWRTSVREFALLPARSWFSDCSAGPSAAGFFLDGGKICGASTPRCNERSVGAELRAEIFFKCSNDFSRVIGDLSVGQRGVAALERDAHEQRIFSGRNIFTAKKIGGFDGSDFANVERLNRFRGVRKTRAFGEEQRKISLDGRKPRQRLIPAERFGVPHCVIKGVDFEFGEKGILP